MNKTIKLSKKYAFSLFERKKALELEDCMGIKNLNYGFYDQIEKKDNVINDSKIKLKKIKSNSFKELIYTNKSIPNSWRCKINYFKDLLNIISKNEKLISYLGNGNSIDSDNQLTSKKTPINLYYKINNNQKKKNRINSAKNIYNYKKLDNSFSSMTISEESNQSNSFSDYFKNNYLQKGKKEFSDKEIMNILDDLRINHPLKEEYEIIQNEKKDDTLSKSFSNSFSNNMLNISKNNKQNFSLNNSLHNIKTISQEKKLKALKGCIYNNIIVIHTQNKNKNKDNLLNGKNMIFNIKKDFEHKIKNPTIKKKLEHIKFYGPYNNFCFPCRKRNIDFYNKLEHNRCLKIIHYIKKTNGNHFFLNQSNSQRKRNSKSNSSILS